MENTENTGSQPIFDLANFTRADIEQFAKGAQPGTDSHWVMRLFGDSVEGIQIETFRTEAAGLLLAVDRELARIGRK